MVNSFKFFKSNNFSTKIKLHLNSFCLVIRSRPNTTKNINPSDSFKKKWINEQMKLTRKIQEKYEPEAKCNLQSNQRFETGMKSNSSGFVFPFKLFPRELTAKSHCTINSPNDEITIVHSFTLLE